MNYMRGDIYYIEKSYSSGSEQQSGRPAIIVSNNANNAASDVIEVVYLTTQPKTDLPTHVTVRSTSKISIALCEQVSSVYKDRIDDYIATCTDEEMEQIDIALTASLGLGHLFNPVEKIVETVTDSAMLDRLREENEDQQRFIAALQQKLDSITTENEANKRKALYATAQNDLLKELYKSQLEKSLLASNEPV